MTRGPGERDNGQGIKEDQDQGPGIKIQEKGTMDKEAAVAAAAKAAQAAAFEADIKANWAREEAKLAKAGIFLWVPALEWLGA